MLLEVCVKSQSECFRPNIHLGIGAAISENLAEKGANLVLSYTSESSAKKTAELAEELGKKYGVSTLIVQADLGTKEGPKQLGESHILKRDQSLSHAGLKKGLRNLQTSTGKRFEI